MISAQDACGMEKSVNGIIIVNKEAGFTSHDVVAKMRGICGQRKSDIREPWTLRQPGFCRSALAAPQSFVIC